MKTGLRTVMVLMAVSLLVTAGASAADLADKLPGSTLAMLSWAGKNKAMDESMLGQMLTDPKCQGIFTGVQKVIEQNFKDDEQKQAFTSAWKMGKTLLNHPCVIAMTDLKVQGDNAGPSLVLLADLGADREAFDKEVDAMLALAPADKVKEQQVHGRKFKSIDADGQIVSFGYVESTFFVSLGTDVPSYLFRRFSPVVNMLSPLTADEKYINAMKAVTGPDQQATFYADIEGILNKVGPAPASAPAGDPASDGSANEWRKVITSLGLGKVTVLAGTTRVVEKGMYTKCKLFTPAPHQGALMLLAGGELTEADLAGVPADADCFVACKTSLPALAKEVRRVVPEISSQANTVMIGALGVAQMATDIIFEKDIFDSLGDTWVISSAASQGGDMTGTVLTVPVKNVPKLQSSLSTLEQKLAKLATAQLVGQFGRKPRADGSGSNTVQIDIESVKMGEADIHYAMAAGLPSPIAPAWTILDGKLYIAGWPQVIQTTLANKTKPLIEDEMYKKVRSKVAAKPSRLGYVNSPQMVGKAYNFVLIYGTLAANMGSGVLKDNPIRPDLLPTLTSIRQYVWPEVSATSFDDDGIIFESYGSIPMSTLFVPAVVLPAAAGAAFFRASAVASSELQMAQPAIAVPLAPIPDDGF